MPPTPEGYLYRRHGNRHYSLGDPAARGYEIYWCIQAYGKRLAVCMHTTSERTARERALRFPQGIDLTGRQRFLKALARAGRLAETELNRSIDAPGVSMPQGRKPATAPTAPESAAQGSGT